jgi:hypothetical protein
MDGKNEVLGSEAVVKEELDSGWRASSRSRMEKLPIGWMIESLLGLARAWLAFYTREGSRQRPGAAGCAHV